MCRHGPFYRITPFPTTSPLPPSQLESNQDIQPIEEDGKDLHFMIPNKEDNEILEEIKKLLANLSDDFTLKEKHYPAKKKIKEENEIKNPEDSDQVKEEIQPESDLNFAMTPNNGTDSEELLDDPLPEPEEKSLEDSDDLNFPLLPEIVSAPISPVLDDIEGFDYEDESIWWGGCFKKSPQKIVFFEVPSQKSIHP